MYIFIDESGIFIDTKNTGCHKVSAVGGLVIPHESYDDLISAFIHLKQHLGLSGEIKGSKLNEDQIDSIVQLLEKFDVLFDAVIIDSSFQETQEIEEHKKIQAQRITQHLTTEHHPKMIQELNDLRNTLETDISNQLYVQSIAMTNLVYNIHQLSTLYYVQRNPRELADFKWIIDAKDKTITTMEKWWKKIVLPFIHDMSISEPMKLITEGDYTHYNKYVYEDGRGGNIKKILEDLSFMDSADNEGLQIIDILTGALCRAMNKKLKQAGWLRIGKLMICQQRQNVQIIVLKNKNKHTLPYSDVLRQLNVSARSMFL